MFKEQLNFYINKKYINPCTFNNLVEIKKNLTLVDQEKTNWQVIKAAFVIEQIKKNKKKIFLLNSETDIDFLTQGIRKNKNIISTKKWVYGTVTNSTHTAVNHKMRAHVLQKNIGLIIAIEPNTLVAKLKEIENLKIPVISIGSLNYQTSKLTDLHILANTADVDFYTRILKNLIHS